MASKKQSKSKPLRSKCSEFIWIQRDGTPIHVRKMDDHHLLHTIRMLRRQSKAYADHYNEEESWGCVDAEDFTSCYFMDDDTLAKAHPTWNALQFERRVRGLEELKDGK